ncbi:ABC transporter ATP-binding protein [Niallia endozanthoxylica]|uniref:ABC transporter ATP-binding protein n=1 Tax=Niallia endozanthoxylica TaxID=2036016 RepID=A0A5J5I8J6_9BACI|nr:ABC transporter ATP-binding protein [Niallia endozanthoxylica]KAA9031228.1 ABC transporter ATP-binding protein [Niallia endozanthoxylica]
MFKELSKPFHYKKLELSIENSKKSKQKVSINDWKSTLKKLWDYLIVHKRILLLVIFMVILSSGLGLLGPFLLGRAIDDYIVSTNMAGLIIVLFSLLIIYALHSLSLWLQNYWMIGIAQKTVWTMRMELFQHLHKLPISFFDKKKHGELMSRVTNDIENVSSTLNSSFIQILSSILTLTGTILVMLILSPILTMVTLIIVPLMFIGMRWITNRTGKLFKEQQRNLGELNGFIEETISGQKIVKAFSQEQKVLEDFDEKSEKFKTAGFWSQSYSGFIPKLMNVLNNLSFAIVAAVGGVLALRGDVTIGTIVIFTEYARQFTRPLNDLANQFNTLLSAVAGAERVFEILEMDEETTDEKEAVSLSNVKGEIEFRNVSFSYEEDSKTIRNVSFIASKGEMIALVGPTGAGKSTIINLLSRFYDAQSGSIWIDGHEIKTVTRESLRKSMAFVLQDSYLFEGTIRENIRFGRLAASDDEVIEAAKTANAHSFIMKLPNQYDTVLKQDGGGISQGQKQLLSIARAVLANPVILILDEATSSIDTVTELRIQEALGRLMKGRTSFVVAHRLNTIRRADQILVLSEGEILERGTHDELLASRGFYYELNGQH